MTTAPPRGFLVIIGWVLTVPGFLMIAGVVAHGVGLLGLAGCEINIVTAARRARRGCSGTR